MIENSKISLLQFGLLVFMFELGSSAILTPSIVVSIAKQDAWISVILSLGVCVLLAFLWTRLSRIYPNESIIQFSERILGKWFGKLVGILYISFFLILGSLVLRDLGDFITTNVLVQTPIEFIHILFMLPVIYVSYLGIEVLARVGEILFPWITVIFFITGILLLKETNLSELLPIWPEGWQPSVKGMYPIIGFPIAELVICMMLIPFVHRPKRIITYFNLSFAIAKLVLTLIVVLSISVLGVDITARSTFTVFEVAKEINVGQFFERVEVLVGVVWILTIFIKLSICFYAANLASAQLFRLKSYRATILPFGMLLLPLSMIAYDDLAEAAWFIKGSYPIYSLFFGLFLPSLLLVTAKFRKLKSN
jgi:spore germination protein KB